MVPSQRLSNPIIHRKRNSAQSLIEVTVGIIVLIPALMVLWDLSIILYGVQLNDTMCRNAARAAATGDPAEASSRAQAILTHANDRANPPVLSNFALVPPVELNITSQPDMKIDPENGKKTTAGGTVNGTTTVTTQVEIRPFIVHVVCGGQLPLKFRTRQTFPISYIMPPSAPN
jgi:hypothetical protein